MESNPTTSNKIVLDDAEDQQVSNKIDYRGATRNETRAYFRNKMEQKRMDTEVNSFKLDAKHNCRWIKSLERRISASMTSIDLSTGHSSFSENPFLNSIGSASSSIQSERSDYLSKRKSMGSISMRTEITSLTNIVENETKTGIMKERMKSASWQQQSESKKEEMSDESANEIISRLEEADGRAKLLIGRLNRSKSLFDGIPPHNRIRSRSAHSAIAFNKNPIEWKFYETQKKLNENIDATKVDIEDKKLLAIYMKKCEVRNSIPKIPKNLVTTLKKKDPIYAKRYRQVYEARICSRAPNFDHSDNNLITGPLPKLDAWRLRKRVLTQSMNPTLTEKPQAYKMEMLKAGAKVKQFLEEVKVTQLC